MDRNISIIYRNYSNIHDKTLIAEIRDFCKKINKKFFLANNIKLAKNLNLDGVYIPSFYKSLNTHNSNTNKKFIKIGSAHSIKEIKIKEKQGVQLIFISPLFNNPKNKNFLGCVKFNNLTLKTNLKTIALGGIDAKNIIRIKLLKCYGFASITYLQTEHKFNNYIL